MKRTLLYKMMTTTYCTVLVISAAASASSTDPDLVNRNPLDLAERNPPDLITALRIQRQRAKAARTAAIRNRIAEMLQINDRPDLGTDSSASRTDFLGEDADEQSAQQIRDQFLASSAGLDQSASPAMTADHDCPECTRTHQAFFPASPGRQPVLTEWYESYHPRPCSLPRKVKANAPRNRNIMHLYFPAQPGPSINGHKRKIPSGKLVLVQKADYEGLLSDQPTSKPMKIRVTVSLIRRSHNGHREHVMLDSKMVSVTSSHRLSFDVLPAVQLWRKNPMRNLGLIVEVEDVDRQKLPADRFIEGMNCSDTTSTALPTSLGASPLPYPVLNLVLLDVPRDDGGLRYFTTENNNDVDSDVDEFADEFVNDHTPPSMFDHFPMDVKVLHRAPTAGAADPSAGHRRPGLLPRQHRLQKTKDFNLMSDAREMHLGEHVAFEPSAKLEKLRDINLMTDYDEASPLDLPFHTTAAPTARPESAQPSAPEPHNPFEPINKIFIMRNDELRDPTDRELVRQDIVSRLRSLVQTQQSELGLEKSLLEMMMSPTASTEEDPARSVFN